MKKRVWMSAMSLSALLSVSILSWADDHGHASGGHMMDGDDMHHHDDSAMDSDEAHHMGESMHGQMQAHMREVMGEGLVNKIMAEHHMVNIKHEAMPEMNWPKMNMNFNVEKKVDLSSLKPGQEVEFTLSVDDNNNYVIKEIRVK